VTKKIETAKETDQGSEDKARGDEEESERMGDRFRAFGQLRAGQKRNDDPDDGKEVKEE